MMMLTPSHPINPHSSTQPALTKNLLKTITLNINGGWEEKEAELDHWVGKHKPDVIFLQELKCDKTKGRYITLKGYKGFQNCLSRRYLNFLTNTQEDDDEPRPKPLIRPLHTTASRAKWGVAILLHNSIAGSAADITPTCKWAKGRVSAVKLHTANSTLTLISVYAPASEKKEKSTFYSRLTEWTKTLQGEVLLGGD